MEEDLLPPPPPKRAAAQSTNVGDEDLLPPPPAKKKTPSSTGGTVAKTTGAGSGSNFSLNKQEDVLNTQPNSFSIQPEELRQSPASTPAKKQAASSARLSEINNVYDQAQGEGAVQQVQQKAKVRPADVIYAGGNTASIADNLAVGLTRSYEGLLKTPRFLYNLAAVPQNFLAEKLDMPALSAKYDDFLQQTNSPIAMSPMTMLDQLGDYYGESAEGYEAKTQKYDDTIIGNIGKGNFKDAGKQVLSQITESAPSMAIMAMTAGAGEGAALGETTKTLANALPFMSQQNARLDEDKTIPEWLKPVNSVFNGLSEVVFDQSFGTQAAIQGIVNQFRNEGRDIAVNSAKDFAKSFIQDAVGSTNKAIKPFITGAIEEGTTQLAQNIVDKYTINPDIDLMQNVADAMIVGSAMTGGITTAGNLITPKAKSDISILESQQQALLGELGNPEISEEAKGAISGVMENNHSTIESIAKQTREAIAKLAPKQQKEVESINGQVESLDTVLNDPAVSDVTKKAIQEQRDTLADQAEEILNSPEEETADEPSVSESAGVNEAEAPSENVESENNIPVSPATGKGSNISELNGEETATTEGGPTAEEITTEGSGEGIEQSTPSEAAKETPVVKPKFTIKGTDVTPKINPIEKEVKKGLKEVFDSNEEISKSGTQEDYQEYLETIFPKSEVKDILYRLSDPNLESFEPSPETRGIYASADANEVEQYRGRRKAGESKIYPVIMDIQNPKSYKKRYSSSSTTHTNLDEAVQEGRTSLTVMGRDGEINQEIAVTSGDQVHILGSQKDIKQFKDFVAKKNKTNENQQPVSEKKNVVTETVPQKGNEKVINYTTEKGEKISFKSTDIKLEPNDYINQSSDGVGYFDVKVGDQVIAEAGLKTEGNDIRVSSIEVHDFSHSKNNYNQGIGTETYKQLAKYASDTYGKLLRSDNDEYRSEQAEGAWNKLVKEGLAEKITDGDNTFYRFKNNNTKSNGVESRTKVSDKFIELIHKNIQSEEVSSTLNNIERETGRTLDATEKDYQRTKRMEAVQHGADVVEGAKEEFGDDYVSKLLDYLDNYKTVSVENRSLVTISLEVDLERRILNEPENELTLEKQLKLVRDVSTKQQRSAAIATGYGILRQLSRVGYDVSQITESFFSSEESQAKKTVQKAIESDADAINKQAESVQSDGAEVITPDVEDAIAKGVEKELQSIYEKLPTKRKEAADKAIAALDKIQKKLRAKTYSDVTGIVAFIDAGITTTKAAIKAGVAVADAVELGINKIKELYGKPWNKESEFRKDMLDGFAEEKVDVTTGKKAPKPKTYEQRLEAAKKRTRERIEEIKEEIANKKRELKTRGNSIQPDAELASLKAEQEALIKLRDKYLPKPDNSISEAKKMEAVTKRIMTEIEDINRQIKQGERDERKEGRDPYKSDKITKLKSERKARLALLDDIDPRPKDFIKEALIEKGFGREITVKVNEKDVNGENVLDDDGKPVKIKEKRNVLDWKKLAGEEGSIERMAANVEEVMKAKGYSDAEIQRMQNSFSEEYNKLRAAVIEKALNELDNRNTPKDAPKTKTSAKRLAELYNYGLFDKESDTYDYLLNNALGLSAVGQEAFFEAKKLGQALSRLYQTKVDDRTIGEFGLKHAVRELNQQIEALLSKVAWEQSNGLFKAATIVKEYMGMAQRGMLQSVKQFIENPLSGAVQRTFTRIGFSFDKVDTNSLEKNRTEIAKAIYEDTVRNGGLAYGDVTTPFITRSRTEDWLSKQSTSKVYHTILSSFLGRAYLEGADSMHKSSLTEKYFTYNLIKVLVDQNNPKRMTKTEAIEYVSDNLTGLRFEEARTTAQEIIKRANKDAGKEIIPSNDQVVTRLATDIVKDSLVQDKALTADEIEASYNAAYRAAGYDLGHEANNPISAMVSNASAGIETKIQKAIKEKKWNEAAAYTFTSIVSRNILNPFVGGGTNWIVLTLQKAGFDYVSPLVDYWRKKDNRLDLTSEQGIRNIEKSLMLNLKSKNTNTRVMVGAMASLLTFAAVKATGADDDIDKWLKKNKWAAKYLKVVSPQMLVLMLAAKDKDMSEYFAQLLNIKVGAFDEGKKLVSGVKELSSGKESGKNKGAGIAGDLIGSRLSTPVLPWRFTRDLHNLALGIQGKPTIVSDYNTSGFFNGYYKGGLIDYLGLRPEGKKNKPLTRAEMDNIIKEATQKIKEKK